ncbi:MAG TPA: hypothetical protein VN441_14935, partial [Syntrophomonas sp.]|nr:hypothetical protein [Syntrophomonas sp.]
FTALPMGQQNFKIITYDKLLFRTAALQKQPQKLIREIRLISSMNDMSLIFHIFLYTGRTKYF